MATEKEWSAAKTLIAEISRGANLADIERTLQSLDQLAAFRMCTIYGWDVDPQNSAVKGSLRHTRILRLRGGAFRLSHVPEPCLRDLQRDVARYDCESMIRQFDRARRTGPCYQMTAHYQWLAGICWEPGSERTQVLLMILEPRQAGYSPEVLNLLECQLPALSSFMRGRLWTTCSEAITNTNPFRLTKRQKEVLRRVVGGAPVTEIATTMGISKRTVTFHLDGIYRRMNVRSRHQAIALAIRHQLFSDSRL